MLISVGSKNPVKVRAVVEATRNVWPHVDVVAVEISGGVSEQPTSDREAITGAAYRAQMSLDGTDADMGVGLEGFIADTEYGMFASCWVVIRDRKGCTGIGGGGKLLLPERVAAEVRSGKELGPVIDELLGECNTKQKQGAVGTFTQNLITRQAAFEHSVILALAPFIAPDYYP
ncbi:MAG: inosine/xanthosine triphosphatase [Theionarchaea archaeon]|nr:inosine/xanthosine triphosphatase [Theionarchaea archaeon]MBU7022192.1 inosine/xanthosine triphosphatase [Theionarchaea archaeon]